MSSAVEIQNLSKRFRLYLEKYSSLKERLLHAGHIPFEDLWALRDVSAEIRPGTTVGILGRNGSGKSTLLKCVAGILQPTSGQVVVRGKVAAMLELGAGFAPDLSGRENIYLNGSLLGLSRKEISHRFDEIVEFAEIEHFIDNQVKYYSSGMIVRLGFSIAVSMDPDILLVDEVLSVGDERFQQKCLERVKLFQEDGRTIIVVSHSSDMLRGICDEILVFDAGRLVTFAPPGEAIRVFKEGLLALDAISAPEAAALPATADLDVAVPARHQVEITSVTVEHPAMGERPYVVTGEPLTIRVDFAVSSAVDGAQFAIEILSDKDQTLFATRSSVADEAMILAPGAGSVTFCFDSLPLLDGRFIVNVDVRDAGGVVIGLAEPACDFEVMNPSKATGVVALPMRVEVVVPGATRRGES
ncbi:MAG TPA: ABC transporter ATP-binding protein [Acidimicrobiales bacterium]|nr:ABC transporter ATP-binding protein [Acidimicrobiales bacterium]